MSTDSSSAKRASRAIEQRKDELAEAVVARHYGREAEIWEPFGEEGRRKSIRDTTYHFTYLAEALAAEDPTLFTEYVAWVKALFAGLDFPDSVVPTVLRNMQKALHDTLEAEPAATANAYVQAGLAHFQQAPAAPPEHISDSAPMAALASSYLDALLAGERQRAARLVLDAVEDGASVKDIYRHVFQPVQREIGRLWQMNRVTVAEEHYCTAATQLIMSQLYPHIFSEARVGRRLVATAVEGELHEIGLRMVADFFEIEGWDTYYMGANMPATDIVRAIEAQEADVLAISATIPAHTGKVRRLIEYVRRTEAGRAVSIIVGGYPFNLSPQLWRNVGADATAADADEALGVVSQLIEDRP